MEKKKIKDEKEGRFMKKISKKFFIAGILALCLAGGTVLASESDGSMMIHPRAQIEYQEEERTVYIVRQGRFTPTRMRLNLQVSCKRIVSTRILNGRATICIE